jgi:hypothetical protein
LDGAASGPDAGQAFKRASLRVTRGHRQYHRSADRG